MNQINDKLTQFQQLLNNEKAAKDMWVTKCEKEQEKNLGIGNELLGIQGIIKDKELHISKCSLY